MTLSFGPNALDGAVDEDLVTGYEVSFVDACGQKLGGAVATVPKRPNVTALCCIEDAYTVTIAARLPTGAQRLAVAPVLAGAGPLPVGELSGVLADYFVAGEPGASTSPAALSVASAARRRAAARLGDVWIALATAVAVTARLAEAER